MFRIASRSRPSRLAGGHGGRRTGDATFLYAADAVPLSAAPERGLHLKSHCPLRRAEGNFAFAPLVMRLGADDAREPCRRRERRRAVAVRAHRRLGTGPRRRSGRSHRCARGARQLGPSGAARSRASSAAVGGPVRHRGTEPGGGVARDRPASVGVRGTTSRDTNDADDDRGDPQSGRRQHLEPGGHPGLGAGRPGDRQLRAVPGCDRRPALGGPAAGHGLRAGPVRRGRGAVRGRAGPAGDRAPDPSSARSSAAIPSAEAHASTHGRNAVLPRAIMAA